MSFTVINGGTYDLFHHGHVNFLRQCKILSNGGEVVVVVNRDEFVKRYKTSPVMNLRERVDVLRGCKYVDEVLINETDEDWKPNIEIVQPDIIAIGSDWAKRDYFEQLGMDQTYLDNRGIMLVYLPYTTNISSTDIRHRLCKKYM